MKGGNVVIFTLFTHLMGSRKKDPVERYSKAFRSRLDELTGIDDPKSFWDDNIANVVRTLYQGLISCVADGLYIQEFLPVGQMYRQAAEIGVLRRRQGVPMEAVMQEHIIFRDVFWEFHRKERKRHDFQVEKRLCQCFNSMLQSTLHAYETQDIILDVMGPIRDPITGLFNSHYFIIRVEEEVRRAERYVRDFTIGVLQIQGLEKEELREEALRGSARALRHDLRASDLVSRLGDEKFAVLLPETTKDGGKITFDRLASVITEYLNSSVQGLGTAKIMVGLASYPIDGDDAVALIEAASEGLVSGWKENQNGD